MLARIDQEIERYRDELPDAQRLADLKSRLKYGFVMSLNTPDRVASSLARLVSISGGVEAVDRLYAAFDAVTPEEIRQAARNYLESDRRTVGRLFGSR